MTAERTRRRRAHPRASLLIACAWPLLAHADGLPWEVWEAPARLAALDPGDRVLQRSSHCLDGCRYDRSNAGAESPAQNPYPLRWLYRDGDEVIVFDERGAGAVSRIWLTTGFGMSSCIDPAVRVRFYLDDAPLPALDVPLGALFDGSTPPFTPPLVADRFDSSGGFVSHVPIAHARALRIALVGAENGGGNPCTGDDRRLLWFQIQHHRIAPGRPVASFVPGADAPGWRAFLAHAGGDPWNAMLAPQDASAMLAPAGTLVLASRAGPGWLRGIRLRLPRAALADIVLRLQLDGEAGVELPLADYFATPVDAVVPARGVLIGEDASGWLYSWFPMPFATAAQVELVALPTLAATVQVESSLAFDGEPVLPDAGRFGAGLVDTSVEGGDATLHAARGAGKLVGLSARYRSTSVPPSPAILEGDERAYVDDAIGPLWQGTGVEDFFGGGFYFDQDAFTQPLAGASLVRHGDAFETAAWRLMLADALPYTRALRLTQEAGLAPAQPSPMCVRAVAYGYRQSRASSASLGRFEIGDASAAAAHAYAPPVDASCAPLQAQFGDEPPTTRDATVCRHSGSSRFRFRIADAAPPLQLVRLFDAGAGVPGEVAGSAAARVLVDGVEVGRFAPAMANPARRWQRDAVFLDLQPAPGMLELEVVAEPGNAAAFSESAWELRGGWTDALFADGFEATALPPMPSAQAH
jgi:hypothetical protein